MYINIGHFIFTPKQGISFLENLPAPISLLGFIIALWLFTGIFYLAIRAHKPLYAIWFFIPSFIIYTLAYALATRTSLVDAFVAEAVLLFGLWYHLKKVGYFYETRGGERVRSAVQKTIKQPKETPTLSVASEPRQNPTKFQLREGLYGTEFVPQDQSDED